MVDHQGLERNVRSQEYREMEGFRTIAGWRYTNEYTFFVSKACHYINVLYKRTLIVYN